MESVEKLKELLGAESKGRWLEFMVEMERAMPFLSSAGAPKKSDIEQSIIGITGHSALRDFLEKELGWSYNSWKAWKKAYLVIKTHPYLADIELSASEINTLKRENSEFPADLETFKAVTEKRQESIDSQHADAVSVLKKALADANLEIERLKSLEPATVEKIVEIEKPVERIKKIYVDNGKHKKMLHASLAVNVLFCVIFATFMII